MGFYIRKAVRVGPLRFNLSNSGIGVSAGLKGFRVGTGPRGTYIHMGRGGLYYRKTLPSSPATTPQSHQPTHEVPISSDGTHEPLHAIESGDIAAMVDSSSKELVDELNSKRKRFRLWPLGAVVGLLTVGLLAHNQVPLWAIYITVGVFSLLTLYLAYRDILSKSVVMLYDVEGEFEDAFQSLHDTFEQMIKCRAVRHLEASGRVKDRKYHAGADTLVKRSPIIGRTLNHLELRGIQPRLRQHRTYGPAAKMVRSKRSSTPGVCCQSGRTWCTSRGTPAVR